MKHQTILQLALSLSFYSFTLPAHVVTVAEFYGDSLTAGFLAETKVEEPMSLKEIRQVKRRIAVAEGLNLVTAHRPRRALEQYDSPNHAWPRFLSDQIDQTWETEKADREVDLQNYAVSGAKSEDIALEVGKPQDAPVEAIAFFFMGHNDLSKSREAKAVVVDRFVEHYVAGLKRWDEGHKNSKAFILPVGNLPAVYDAVDEFTWREKRNKRETCDDMWRDRFPYWRFFPGGKKGAPDDFAEEVGGKIKAMNEGLVKIVEEFKSENGNRAYSLDGLFSVKLEPKYFAADCFHLSEAGQKFLAGLVFARVAKLL